MYSNEKLPYRRSEKLKIGKPLKAQILSPFFYPEPISTGKYNTHLAKALLHKKWAVEVVTFHPFYPNWKPAPTRSKIRGIKIQRTGAWLRFPKSLVIRRIVLETMFFLHALRYILSRRDNDVLFCIFPPSLMFFLLSPFIPKRTKTIGIVHDIMGIMANASKSPLKTPMIKTIKLLECLSYNSCDKLIFLSESMADIAQKQYRLDVEKNEYCYPFPTLSKKEGGNSLQGMFLKDYKHVVYSGAVGEKQNPFEMVKLFEAIVSKRDDFICHIFSSGPLFEELREITTAKHDRICFHALVAEDQIFELYLRSDLQIIPQVSGTSNGAIPSKLPNILMVGTPIFIICDEDSELSQIVSNPEICHCANSWEIDKVANELITFLDEAVKRTHKDRQRVVQSLLKEKFSIHKLLKSIIA